MHRTLLTRSVAAIAVVIAMAGCDPQAGTDDATTLPAPAASSAAPADNATSAAADDEATAKACAEIKKDLKENSDKIAEAEKIGPPAGHIAVSAQWAAGSASLIARSTGANETVRAAADEVQAEMMSLSDEYNESAKAKPSKKKLEAAVSKLTGACSAT